MFRGFAEYKLFHTLHYAHHFDVKSLQVIFIHFFFSWQGKSAEIKCECLDILSDVLNRFGNVIAKDHAYMLTALLSQLSSTQASVRKKSVSCIGTLECIL
jgi:hypothetical protein